MNLLITGIHGFVGSNLVRTHAATHTIYGLDIVAPNKEGVVATYSWNDLDRAAIPPVDAIVHLAGKAHDTKNEAAAQTYFDINTGLTKKIFDYFLASQARVFIFFSSVKAAADTVGDTILTEEVVPSPKGPYGESKLAAEEYIRSHATITDGVYTLPGGKRVYILRPCMIHGPGNKGNLNLLYNVVRTGMPWPLAAFDNRRTFTSVDNLCYVISRLVEGTAPGGVYNMGDDESLSTNELVAVICRVLGKKVRLWHIGRGLMTRMARVGGALHLPLNPERLQKLTENYVVSNHKIKQALSIDTMPVRAADGLRITIESFVNNNK